MKTLNMKKIAIFMLVVMTLLFTSTITAFATTVDTTIVEEANSETTDNSSALGTTKADMESDNPAGLPEASVEDLQEKAESKMFSIVTLLQTIGKPFFIICFIIATIVTIVGLFGKGGVWKGVIGMFLSGILYTCVMYAPEIVEWIQIWAAS